jgi:hypothetical protein
MLHLGYPILIDEHGHGQGQYATIGGGRWEASRDAGHNKNPQRNNKILGEDKK